MRTVIPRAAMAAGAALAVLVPAAAAAAGTATVVLGWAPATAGGYSYGTLAPGHTAAKTFTLTNTGSAASSALKITLAPGSGTPPAAFTKTADTCTGTSLGPKKTCTVTITYTAPTVPGQASAATLTAVSNKPAATTTLALTGAAAKATPAIATDQQPASAPVGSPVADQATVSGGNAPTGTVTFNLYDNPGCSGTALLTDTEPLSGGSAASAAYTATAAGTDYWQATYNGDSTNNPVSSSCSGEPVTIAPATPAITAAPQPSTATAGSGVADQATVSGGFHPSGTVTFNLYGPSTAASCPGTPVFTDTETLSGGTATSAQFTAAQAGSYWWTATYNGDTNNNTAGTGCGDEQVVISPAFTTSPSAGGPAGATTVTDTATLSGGNNPTGTITYNLYGPSYQADCSGTPVDTETVTVTGNGSYTTPAGATPAQVGTYWWTASYSGDTNNPPASAGCGAQQVLITGDFTLSPGRFFSTSSPNLNVYTSSIKATPGTTTTQTFTVTNSGNTTSDGLTLEPKDYTPQFSFSNNNCSQPLGPGATCTFDATLTAPAAGCQGVNSAKVLLTGDTTGDLYINLYVLGLC